jgi:hypothetical protein
LQATEGGKALDTTKLGVDSCHSLVKKVAVKFVYDMCKTEEETSPVAVSNLKDFLGSIGSVQVEDKDLKSALHSATKVVNASTAFTEEELVEVEAAIDVISQKSSLFHKAFMFLITGVRIIKMASVHIVEVRSADSNRTKLSDTSTVLKTFVTALSAFLQSEKAEQASETKLDLQPLIVSVDTIKRLNGSTSELLLRTKFKEEIAEIQKHFADARQLAHTHHMNCLRQLLKDSFDHVFVALSSPVPRVPYEDLFGDDANGYAEDVSMRTAIEGCSLTRDDLDIGAQVVLAIDPHDEMVSYLCQLKESLEALDLDAFRNLLTIGESSGNSPLPTQAHEGDLDLFW